MKIFTIVFTLIALALIVFNITKINFDTPFQGDSTVALITIFTALCGIILLQIFRLSKRIEKQSKK